MCLIYFFAEPGDLAYGSDVVGFDPKGCYTRTTVRTFGSDGKSQQRQEEKTRSAKIQKVKMNGGTSNSIIGRRKKKMNVFVFLS
jgi:hypothetical protein